MGSCANHAKCPPYAKVAKSYYLGRGYGDYGEKKMMKELMRNGIINAEFEGGPHSSAYSSGIISQKAHTSLMQKY